MSHQGHKVTTDPESYKNPINEAVGTVTSDSLAAESLKNDGSFGSENPKAAASQQPSASTTTNNTDTSSATRLDPAVNAGTREAHKAWNQDATLSTKGLGRESGVGPTYNTPGSSVNSHGTTRGIATTTSGGADAVQGNIAPSGAYAGQELDNGVYKPKGRNITEDPNLQGDDKFGAIGTEDDAGRVAELEFAKRTAAVGGGGKGGLEKGGEGRFSGLASDEHA